MDGKHAHVKDDWDEDQAESASKEMLEPQTLETVRIALRAGSNVLRMSLFVYHQARPTVGRG